MERLTAKFNGQVSSEVPIDLDNFSNLATEMIHTVLNRANGLGCKSEIVGAIDRWRQDDVHGVRHSYDVYQASLNIAEKDQLIVDNPTLFVLATIHDLSEFLPLIDHRTGQVLSGDQESTCQQHLKEQKHDVLMAWLLRYISTSGLVTLPKTLAHDVLHHDVFWSRPSRHQMDKISRSISIEGAVLADADRLVNGGRQDLNLDDSVYFNILRSWQYGIGREFFYRDLPPEDRFKWRKRTAGLFDCLSSLVAEFTAPDYVFHTQSGKFLNQYKKSVFNNQLQLFLSELYQTQTSQFSRIANSPGLKVEYGLKISEARYSLISNSKEEAVASLLSMPVEELKADDGRQYYGYSFLVDGQWIDPSVVVYNSVEEFSETVIDAVRNYENYLDNR